ncbi:ABC transporter substrate-binding protein [Brevibacillus fulvus]|uniref:Peptide/nickel transport system substrate-binding protein n=1 Tax=Brevibacillus fulvus TaxID=1125967 RepID=A0A938Y2A9_9BACL|nr:ABC transporter substrate-binding protein [Brevibacillus fulvus]MBM7590337.1 peptide/nickel transport system substrate-binding protein [Brevibacillus fulvus]
MFSKKFSATLATVILGSMVALAGCGGQSSAPTTPSSGAANSDAGSAATAGKKVLNIALKADPPSMDPMASTSLYDRQVQNSIYDKLFDISPEGKIVPALVDSYEVSEDGKTYTFTLKEGIKFQDGTDFNAEAVKFNLERDLSDNSKRKAELNLVDKIETPDAKTVVVTLKSPFAPFISVLTDRAGMMVSPAAVKQYGDDYINHPVGTGPFVFVEHVKGDHVTLKKNENYWNGAPKLDEVTYKVFTNTSAAVQNLRSGMVDIIDEIPIKEIPTVAKDPNLTAITKPNMGYQGMFLNTKKGPLANQYLRQAVDRAIDRETVVKVLFDGYGAPAWSPFPPGSMAYNEATDNAPKPNAAEIKELLAKGGQPNGFSFKLQISTTPANEQFGAVIQNMLKPYGINVQLEKVEYGTLLENGDNGNFEALQLGWSGRIDPDQNFYSFVVTDMPNNYAGISSPELDKAMEQARTELDDAKRAELYKQAMDALHENAGYSYIYHNYDKFGLSKKVTGFTYVPDGIIRVATVDKQ